MFFDVGGRVVRVHVSSDLDNQALGIEFDDVAHFVAEVFACRHKVTDQYARLPISGQHQ